MRKQMSMSRSNTNRDGRAGVAVRAAVAAPGAVRGFSLIEMMVSLAVLVIAMAVVSNIFGLTARTAVTAVAISDTQSRVRDFTLNVERDLDAINPAESILVISGETQAAALTDDDLQAGRHHRVLVGDPAEVPGGYDPRYANSANPESDQYSDPRTDILMFLTNRASPSRAPAQSQGGIASGADPFERSLGSGMRVSPVLVTYGHAAFAKPKISASGVADWPDPGSEQHIFTGNPGNRTQLSPIPASQWHVARRALLVENVMRDTSTVPEALSYMFSSRSNYALKRLKLGRPSQDFAGDSIDLRLDSIFEQFSPTPPAVALRAMPLALRTPYVFSRWPSQVRGLVNDMLFLASGDHDRHIATVINNPPPELSANLGVQGLPGCAWFQVEFLMPEDPRNAADYPIANQRDDMPHWVEVTPGETYVFVPDTAENRALVANQVAADGSPVGGSRLAQFAQVIPPGSPYQGPNTAANRKIRMWPYAIRVTVHAYDPQGRLEEPIVRSVVHRFD